ncbi:MAG TPA: hypothetical protein VFI65_22475 [Streptosporangiaceae bacterium]|nr:hypothetical protein [Streptosporangiaceae bacterium]
MRSHAVRRLVYAAGVTGLLATGSAAASAAIAAPDLAAVPVKAAVATAAETSPILLITGMRFGFAPGASGRSEPVMLPAKSTSTAPQIMPVTEVSLAGRSFEIPADALPYLGHGLDPGLFDLAALRRVEHGGRLPVRVSYQGQVPVLPGIRITSAATGTARGYLTAGSSLKFGAALRRQFAADHDRASYGTDGLFARRVSISLAGAAVPRPVRPQFQMHTLTVHATNLAGKPDNGDAVMVFNADDSTRFGDPNETFAFFEKGVAKFSVPEGHYWVIGDFAGSSEIGDHVVVRPQVDVLTDTAQVNLDERSATSQVRVTTPRPAVLQVGTFTIARTPVLPGGKASSFAELTFRGQPLWVNPTHMKPTTGGLQAYGQFQLASRTSRHGVPYAYSVDLSGPAGLIPSAHFRVRPSTLATVDNRYFQDFRSIGGWNIIGGTRPEFDLIAVADPVPLRLPGQLIEYVTASPHVVWSQTYFQFAEAAGCVVCGSAAHPEPTKPATSGMPSPAGGQTEPFRSFRPGQRVTEDWNIYPLHPQPEVSLARFGSLDGPPIPAAARVGDELTLNPTVFSDNTPGHLGAGYFDGTGLIFVSSSRKISGSFRVEQNGKTLASGNPVHGLPQVKLSDRPSLVRFTLTARRKDRHYDLSTASDTTWTWRSQPDPKAQVPARWGCLRATRGFTRQCAVQPMLTLRYQVAGLRLDGSTAPGRQVIRLSVGHVQLASDPAITRATMRVSFNGGKTWHTAKVTRSGKPGQFTAEFTAPAKAFVTLRVTAADKAGGSVLETITSAYKTSS